MGFHGPLPPRIPRAEPKVAVDTMYPRLGPQWPQAPPGHQGKGRLGYRVPLWDPMEPSFLAPFPSAGTGANFNLVSRPPESVCLITQVEIQGVDSLLGCFPGDRSHLSKIPWRPRRPIVFWIRRTGLRARPRGRPTACCVKVRPRESAGGQSLSTGRGPITCTFHCATLILKRQLSDGSVRPFA